MNELSVSVTFGVGCEKHNHDSGYRLTLDHVLPMGDGELELIPYVDYNTRINTLLRPAIEEYNQRRQLQRQEAMSKFEKGQRKTRPKEKDYLPMSYNYAEAYGRRLIHNPSTHRTEEIPLFREIIVKIANIRDRVTGNLPDYVAQSICKDVVAGFAQEFPLLYLLGCTAHTNELGTIHLHIDFVAISRKLEWKTGLPVSLGLNHALQQMGYVAETSIMCAKTERAPILFNAMRNRVFKLCEKALVNHGFCMQYESTAKNYPSLDPSVTRSLEEFQYLADHARWIQHLKNITQDFLQEHLRIDDLSSALETYRRITESVYMAKNVASQVCEFGYEITADLLFAFHRCCVKIVEQEVSKAQALNTTLSSTADSARELLRTLTDLTDQCNALSQKKKDLEQRIAELRTIVPQFESRDAIGSRPKKYSVFGQQLISNREYNALIRAAECLNDISEENKVLISQNEALRQNTAYLSQVNLRMESLLMQYAPKNAEQEIQRAKRDLTDMTVRDYYTQGLMQIKRATKTLESTVSDATETIDEVADVIGKGTEDQSCRNSTQPSLSMRVNAAELAKNGKRMLSEQELVAVYDFGRLIGLHKDEVGQLVDCALYGSRQSKHKAWTIWQQHKTWFIDNYQSTQQEIKDHLDELYRTRQKLHRAQWLLDPRNTRKSLWGILYALILCLSSNMSHSEVDSAIANYRAARVRLQQYAKVFRESSAKCVQSLGATAFDLEEYMTAIAQMYTVSDSVLLAVLDIPLERQYVLTDQGMVSKADLIKQLQYISHDRD